MLKNKSCPLYKSTLPVYFVGILSTLVEVELNGWAKPYQDLNLNSQKATIQLKSNISPNSKSNKLPISKTENLSVAEKRLEYMNEYLKSVFFALSLNQANFDGLICIYELMK
jgi:hypothetical protein